MRVEQVVVAGKGDPPNKPPRSGGSDSGLGTSIHTSTKSTSDSSKSATNAEHQVIYYYSKGILVIPNIHNIIIINLAHAGARL